MADTISRLQAETTVSAQTNNGRPWSWQEVQTELLMRALGYASGVVPTGNYQTTTFTTGGVASNIPAGVLSWSFTCLTGTSTVGSATVAAGQTTGGGGYGGLTLKTAIPWTMSGTAMITWDVIA